jgi:pimeloyl-ACP methyl ester carboxylesterase
MTRNAGWLLVALAMGCSGGEDGEGDGTDTDTNIDPVEEAPDYADWGPYSVGTAEGTVPGPDGLTLTAQFWFPSADAQGEPVTYDGLLPGEATEGLEPLCDAPWPVVAFSHGLGGVRWQSPFFVEHLASHGYFVVAVDHAGSGLFDTNFAQIGAVAMRRPLDVAAAFDGAADQYPDCIDPEAGYAVSGHSFGGYTAFAVAGAELNNPLGGGKTHRGDDRVWATIGLAPWDGSGVITDGNADIEVPALILTGRQDETTGIGQVQNLWRPLQSTLRAFGVFEEVGHYSFAPAGCILGDGDGCGAGFLAPDAFDPVVNQATAAFLGDVRGIPGAREQLGLGEAAAVEWEIVEE